VPDLADVVGLRPTRAQIKGAGIFRTMQSGIIPPRPVGSDLRVRPVFATGTSREWR